jgi:hypothetical protein
MDGKTVYETDIIRKDGKWEVIVAEDGSIVSKNKEGSADEKEIDRKEAQSAGWKESFDVDKSRLAATGNNPYLAIQPGRVLKLKSGIDSLTVSILPDTITIDGVKCGILEERETKDGKLIEVSRTLFATDSATGDVTLLRRGRGQLKDGKIVDHENAGTPARRAGFGLMMPATPGRRQVLSGDRPKVAMDRVSVSTEPSKHRPGHSKPRSPEEAHRSRRRQPQVVRAPGVGMVRRTMSLSWRRKP